MSDAPKELTPATGTMMTRGVRGLRGARSLREVAAEIGISQDTLSRFERGLIVKEGTFAKIVRWNEGEREEKTKAQENTSEITAEDSKNRRLADPWKPGQSGNPAGRPKGAKNGLQANLRRMLKSQAPGALLKSLKANEFNLSKGTMAEAIAHIAGLEALKGEVAAMRYISEQTEIALPKTVELTGPDGGAIVTQMTRIDMEKLSDEELRAYQALVDKGGTGREGEG